MLVEWVKRGTPEFETLKHSVVGSTDHLWAVLDTGEMIPKIFARRSREPHKRGFFGWFIMKDLAVREVSELSVKWIAQPVIPS